MSFSWSAYLELANDLALRKENEAVLRSAVSRAYYAAFHLTSRRLRARNVPLDDTLGPHERVWKPFTNHADRACASIGIIGERLKRSRKAADYDDRVPDLQLLCQKSLQLSIAISEGLQNLPPSLP